MAFRAFLGSFPAIFLLIFRHGIYAIPDMLLISNKHILLRKFHA